MNLSQPTNTSKKPVKDFLEGLFVALIFALLIRQFVVQAYTIPTPSMEKSLLVGDFLLVNKFTYGMQTPDWIGIPYTRIGFEVPWVYRFPSIKEPEPFDVIIFRYPKDKHMDYIKRCIAAPGQTVEIKDKVIYLDGEPFKKPPQMQFIDRTIQKRSPNPLQRYNTFKSLGTRDNYGPITLPESMYWAMGDNRDNSADSRYWGFVPRKLIVGQALMIYMSIDTKKPWSQMIKHIRFNRFGQVIR